jgi:hypothetical protein
MHGHNAGEHRRKRILNGDEINALWKAGEGIFERLADRGLDSHGLSSCVSWARRYSSTV